MPWARHGASHTRAFDDTVAWLAVQCYKTAVTELMRVAWRTVGSIVGRVGADIAAAADRFTPLYAADRPTQHFRGAEIHLKRPDLCHTGAHKLNNALGQASRPFDGKRRVIAGTGPVGMGPRPLRSQPGSASML